ncbi:ATP-binding protein [Spirillospora sp. CA-294931]|uniref:ATP-binding protein n=1 Tax=Spirillospora sp. CA-294931 TaxID=3240042 RepID=UPI003D934243
MGSDTAIHDELDIGLPGTLTAPGHVRTLLRFRLTEWGLDHLAHDLCLIAGELIANAVQATPGREIRVRFVPEPDAVRLCVWDSCDRSPISTPVTELSPEDIVPDLRALDPGHDDGTGGWGLPIVEALASECGVHPTEPHGKWVWARLAIR